MKNKFSVLLSVLAVLAVCSCAQAQTAPDAGALRQRIERDRELPLPSRVLPTPAPQASAKLPNATVTISSIRFVGNTLLSAAQLAPAVQGYLNQPQSFSQLQQAAAAVSKIYRDAGWLVHAYLPRQDLADGVLTIQIDEAVYSGASVAGAEPSHVKSSQVLAIFQAQQASGQFLNADALDRALLLADDLPGLSVAGTLVAGAQDGETGISLKLADKPGVNGDATIDNAGARATGSERLSTNLYLNSLFGVGDQAVLNLIDSSGSDYVRLGLTSPVGSDGWRVGANASSLYYRIVAPEFSALMGSGQSASYGLEASYPLIRARNRNLYVSLNYDQKSFHNESNGVVQSDYGSSDWALGLSGNLFDALGGGGANSGSVALVAGRLALGSLQVGENAASNGDFDKLHFAFARQQALGENLALHAALSGQQANRALDSSEKFSLGGASGVRAYPSGEGSGSSGQLLTTELRWRLPAGLSLSSFYDWGQVSNNDGSPSYSLHGAGFGMAWQSPIGATLSATLAQRTGSNPNPTSTGTDQDGSFVLNRWWLAASVPF